MMGINEVGRATPHRPLQNAREVVSSSPNPVDLVRQVEEDESMARMLQTQFDAEVDPDDSTVDHELMDHELMDHEDSDDDSYSYSDSEDSDSDERNPHIFSPYFINVGINNGRSGVYFYTSSTLDFDEEHIPQGLSEIEINRLPTHKYIHPNSAVSSSGSEVTHKKTELNEVCQVCLTDFETGVTLRILPCFHKFHTLCIDRWLLVDHICPVCRAVVDLYE